MKSLWRRAKSLVCAIVGLCVFPGLVAAATFHVSPQGSNTPPYDTYANAAHEVADAVLAASGYGDTVLVHAGQYDIDTTIDIPLGLAWAGVGMDSVSLVLRGAPTLQVLADVQGDNEIWGMEFVNPLGPYYSTATGVLTSLDAYWLQVHDCRFDQIRLGSALGGEFEVFRNEFIVSNGEGVTVVTGEPTTIWIHHNTFLGTRGSTLGGGRGIRVSEGDLLVENNVFDWPGDAGLSIDVDRFPIRAVVRNNLIVRGLGFWWFKTTGIIENNTIVGPSYRNGGIVVAQDAMDTLVIRNNVFLDFAQLPSFWNYYLGVPNGPIEFTYNAFWPPTDSFYVTAPVPPEQVLVLDSQNFNAYGMFVVDSIIPYNIPSYKLQRGSPLINAGDPTLLDPDGTRSDIGWRGGPSGIEYEYLELPPLAPDSVGVNGKDTIVTVIWSARPEADLAAYRVYRGIVPSFWSPGETPLAEFERPDTSYVDTLPRFLDTVYYVVTAVDTAGMESAASAEVMHVISEHRANRPPSFSNIGDQTVSEGDTLSVVISASDEDGDSLIIRAEDLPVNSVLEDHGDGTASFEFAPDTLQAGVYRVRFIVTDGSLADSEEVRIRVNDIHGSPLPRIPQIVRAYPNPFNATIVIEYALPNVGAQPAKVQIRAYDVLGRLVATIYDGNQEWGIHTATWSALDARGRGLSSGMYLLQLSFWGRATKAYKVVLVK